LIMKCLAPFARCSQIRGIVPHLRSTRCCALPAEGQIQSTRWFAVTKKSHAGKAFNGSASMRWYKQFVEVVGAEQNVVHVLFLVEHMLATSVAFGTDQGWRNDNFGSRLRASVGDGTVDEYETWTSAQLQAGRPFNEVLSELMASGLNEASARLQIL